MQTTSKHYKIQNTDNKNTHTQPYLHIIYVGTNIQTKLFVYSSLLILQNVIYTRLNMQVYNTILDMHTHPKNILGFTLDPKPTYNKHIDNTAAKTYKTIPILKLNTWKNISQHIKP